jgi:predicted ferric reductase
MRNVSTSPARVRTVTDFDAGMDSSQRRRRQPRVAVRPSPAPRPALGKLAVTAALSGLVFVLVLGIASETRSELALPGGLATFVGSLTGLAGMYLALVMVVIVARIPPLERILGQDGMLLWHRRLAPWPLSLIAAHALFITLGYAQAARSGVLHEFGALIAHYPDMLAAVVALVIMLSVGVASVRALRIRLRRETWWVLHLYMYLALALSFAHVIALGPAFVGHPLTQALWSLVWAITAGTVLVYRFGLPLVRSLRHRLRVVEVRREAPGVVSVVMAGRHVERLAVSGGQFIAWRFLTRGLWWQAHPYSLSALPRPPYLRITVKQVGDHSTAVARLRPGTKVAIEGPYGNVTRHAMTNPKVALVAGGIGVTALRSLLEDLPRGTDPVVIVRAAAENQLVLRDELAELVRRRNGTLHELVGSRRQITLNGRTLLHLVPDLRQRDLYTCGPPGLVEDVVMAAKRVGVPHNAIHHEIFSW